MSRMKRLLLLACLIAASLVGHAQEAMQAAINEIKLSGKYFTAEATASNEADAKRMAMMSLMGNIAGYCEENEMVEVAEAIVSKEVESKTMRRGEATLVMVYVPRSIVNGSAATATSTARVQQPQETPPAPPKTPLAASTPQPSNVASRADVPNIISRLCGVDSYASMQFLLGKAQDNGMVEFWGKYRTASNPDACYLVAVDVERHVVGVLSPKHGGERTNLKTGAAVDTDGMNAFANCVLFCVFVK